MKVGFIGLGVMGQSMAGHILEAGHELFVFNRTKSKANNLVEQGATWLDTPKEVAEAAELVITIVGYPKDIEEVYYGESGLFAGAHSKSLFIDMTTSTPSLAVQLADKGKELNVGVLDAPVTGGDVGAREGRLAVLVGGHEADLKKAKTVIDTFAANVTHFGEHGAGQHAKAVNQIMVAGTMLGLAEMMTYAKTAELPLDKIVKTIGSGAASNRSLDNYGPRIIQDDYTPGFFVKHFVKDLKIALDESKKMELELPMTELAHKLYTQLAEAGHSDEGTQAIVKLWWDGEFNG
ncbi:NAD(P)-dependent oxidoreductase [Ruoffia tabacinasalis]|uniref:NAD(P)-dependent oxidoreductase n=1 Tax=Ruoffia tabacinasalis TaxID=87458 RepID=A0ABS0LJT8_9LACT|nr:NAD(P)-dependent oxidoreductase [Ruoffia tabacinasalis]MBG9978540.1 NAD(P)-dependent oxidoreductase [Ruoffia tabacinasalis]